MRKLIGNRNPVICSKPLKLARDDIGKAGYDHRSSGPRSYWFGRAKVELAAITSPKEHRNNGINQEWKIYERQSEMFSYDTDFRYTAH
jgi:hypothetical protein